MRFCSLLISLLFLTGACSKIGNQKLEDYLVDKPQSEEWLIACSAGDKEGFNGEDFPVSVFFYPVPGATDYRYFESRNTDIDPMDFSAYKEVENLQLDDVFNGYLKRFRVESSKERYGIVTYLVDDSVRISDPIILQSKSKPTETSSDLVSITENGITPSFSWEDGTQKDNVIYFQVISETDGDLISGTYTTDRFWTFYDLSNVVLDINQGNLPEIEAGKSYNFTLMSVNDDNWVNVAVTVPFQTF